MIGMNGLKLINTDGEELSLLQRGISVISMDGLGFDRDLAFTRSGNDFVETQDDPVQKEPSGEIAFEAEAVYHDFLTFVAKTPLKLAYMPESTWYYLNVKIKKLSKSEATSDVLFCDIDFSAYGMWYLPALVKQVSRDTSAGKQYAYRYPYRYVDTARGTVILENGGAMEAPCKLYVFGPCKNPSWTLMQGGEILLTGKVVVTLGAAEKLVVDANVRTMEIARRGLDNGFLSDEYPNSDFSTERFVTAPPGESALAVTHEGSEVLTVIVEVTRLADAV